MVSRSSVVRTAFLIFVCSLFVRGLGAILAWGNYSADPDAYVAIATTIEQEGVFGLATDQGAKPTAFRPPLYPYLLSWMSSDGQLNLVLVAIFHTFLGAVTSTATYLLAIQLVTGSRRQQLAVVASALVVFDPILLQQSSLVMTETLATALASLGLCLGVHGVGIQHNRGVAKIGWLFSLGVLLAFAFLCRPTFLVWAGLLAVAVFVATDEANWKRRIICSMVVILPVLFAVTGWTIRNQRVMGHSVWATTHGGYTLLLANNPLFYDYLRNGRFGFAWDAQGFVDAHANRYNGDPTQADFWNRDWDSSLVKVRDSVSEVEDDRRCYLAAKATINREPNMFFWSCLVRVGRLWSPFPHRTPERSALAVYAVGTFYTLLYIAIGVGAWRVGRNFGAFQWWPVWCLVVTLTAVHAIYWSNLRMRAPIAPVFATLAAAGLVGGRWKTPVAGDQGQSPAPD